MLYYYLIDCISDEELSKLQRYFYDFLNTVQKMSLGTFVSIKYVNEKEIKIEPPQINAAKSNHNVEKDKRDKEQNYVYFLFTESSLYWISLMWSLMLNLICTNLPALLKKKKWRQLLNHFAIALIVCFYISNLGFLSIILTTVTYMSILFLKSQGMFTYQHYIMEYLITK